MAAGLNIKEAEILRTIPYYGTSEALSGKKYLYVVDALGATHKIALDTKLDATKRTVGSKLHYHDGTTEYLGALLKYNYFDAYEYTQDYPTHPYYPHSGSAGVDSTYLLYSEDISGASGVFDKTITITDKICGGSVWNILDDSRYSKVSFNGKNFSIGWWCGLLSYSTAIIYYDGVEVASWSTGDTYSYGDCYFTVKLDPYREAPKAIRFYASNQAGGYRSRIAIAGIKVFS